MIVGPASRNQGMVMSAYPTAALLRSLQWVSDEYVSPRDTVLIGVSAMGGCVATAGRHSLLSLPRQLVNYSLSVRRIKETTNIIITLRRGNNEFYRINELLDE